jgi:hypothetical protein
MNYFFSAIPPEHVGIGGVNYSALPLSPPHFGEGLGRGHHYFSRTTTVLASTSNQRGRFGFNARNRASIGKISK